MRSRREKGNVCFPLGRLLIVGVKVPNSSNVCFPKIHLVTKRACVPQTPLTLTKSVQRGLRCVITPLQISSFPAEPVLVISAHAVQNTAFFTF